MMKKRDFKKLAIMGITGGVMLAVQSVDGSSYNQDKEGHFAPSTFSNSYHGCGNSGGGNGCGNKWNAPRRNNQPISLNDSEQPRQHQNYNPARNSHNQNAWQRQNNNHNNHEYRYQNHEEHYGPRHGHGCGNAANFAPISEEQFVNQLNKEGKDTYNSLSPEGKNLALRLAKQYSDKNEAVKHAKIEIERQSVHAQ